jgi:hypothetical protein
MMRLMYWCGAGWYSGKIPKLYSGGAWFVSQPGQRHSHSPPPQSVQADIFIVFQLGHAAPSSQNLLCPIWKKYAD